MDNIPSSAMPITVGENRKGTYVWQHSRRTPGNTGKGTVKSNGLSWKVRRWLAMHIQSGIKTGEKKGVCVAFLRKNVYTYSTCLPREGPGNCKFV